jgi:hypothetical protein
MLCYGFPWPRIPASNAKVSSWLKSFLHLVDQITFCIFPHNAKQDSPPTTSLISKQVVPYQRHGGTCSHGVSTPKIWSLADSNMTDHITGRIPTISTIRAYAQTTASNLTTVNSHHDGWKINTVNKPQAKLNIIKMKDLHDTHICRAKQYYPSI